MRRREASRRAPPPPLCALHLTRVVHRCAVLLMVLLLPYAGPRWAVIAQSLSGRTDDAVRNRYLRLSKKNGDLSQRDSLKKGDMWTTAEDDLINDGVQRYGQKWHVIADFLPGRSANAVRNRYLRQTAKQEGGASASHHPVATTQVACSWVRTRRAQYVQSVLIAHFVHTFWDTTHCIRTLCVSLES